eukprot:2329361-Ditylum_brightwellii.AAC.1
MGPSHQHCRIPSFFSHQCQVRLRLCTPDGEGWGRTRTIVLCHRQSTLLQSQNALGSPPIPAPLVGPPSPHHLNNERPSPSPDLIRSQSGSSPPAPDPCNQAVTWSAQRTQPVLLKSQNIPSRAPPPPAPDPGDQMMSYRTWLYTCLYPLPAPDPVTVASDS